MPKNRTLMSPRILDAAFSLIYCRAWPVRSANLGRNKVVMFAHSIKERVLVFRGQSLGELMYFRVTRSEFENLSKMLLKCSDIASKGLQPNSINLSARLRAEILPSGSSDALLLKVSYGIAGEWSAEFANDEVELIKQVLPAAMTWLEAKTAA